jgi:hypothetical protein
MTILTGHNSQKSGIIKKKLSQNLKDFDRMVLIGSKLGILKIEKNILR